ncbi:hypothetical protein OG985_03610 [Streptomyces sp. NBC_00289]|uniref:hypothetical protein n=1 Tax=Streptomyces sp. NBC_00289 TaxID=2975703 RepID=UPI003250AD9A
MRDLNRLEFVGETLRAALEAVAVAAPKWLASWMPGGWQKQYKARVDSYRLPSDESERTQLTWRIAADGYQFLGTTLAAGAPAWLRQVPAVGILRTVWLQQFQRTITDGARRCSRRPSGVLPAAGPWRPAATYRSLNAEQIKAYAKASLAGTQIAKYATGKELRDVKDAVFVNMQSDIVFTGEPKITAKEDDVVLNLEATPQRATLRLCFDLNTWEPKYKKTGKSAAAPNQAKGYPITAHLQEQASQWRVAEERADRPPRSSPHPARSRSPDAPVPRRGPASRPLRWRAAPRPARLSARCGPRTGDLSPNATNTATTPLNSRSPRDQSPHAHLHGEGPPDAPLDCF